MYDAVRSDSIFQHQPVAAEKQGQQFEERLRIAERIVQALHEAGHSCGLADKAYSLSGVDLPTRH